MAKQPLSLFIVMLIVISSCFSGCSSKKKKNTPAVVTTPTTTVPTTTPTTTTPTTTTPTTTPSTTPTTSTVLEGEDVKVGDLMITFSTTNDLMTEYPSFKLGLYDIVAYIRTKDDLYRASLYDLTPVATDDFQSVTPVELSSLREDARHLYHGMFKAPAGKLESLAIQFVGSSSMITIGNNVPSLIDAFFSSYTPGDARVPLRVFPAEVTTKVTGDINVADTKLTMVDVEVDMNITASMEPLRHADPTRTYALFTPSIKVKELTGNVAMRINQVDLVSVTDTSMGMGDPEGSVLTLNYTKAVGAKTYMDGAEAAISGAEGLYHVDMSGTFSASAEGFAFDVNQASLAALAENKKGVIYEGKLTVDGTKASMKGTLQALATDEVSLMGSLPFDGEIAGVDATALSLESDNMATIWSDGTSAKLIAIHAAKTAPSKLVFDLHSTVSYTPADILSISTATSTDTAMTVTLSESLACDQIVRDISAGGMKACDTALTTLEFTKATVGMFTLHETRQGKVGEADADGLKPLSLATDNVHHFTKAGDFLAALENRVKTDKYRLATMIAEGTVDGATFKIGSSVKAIVLQPHEVLDSDSDGWITGLEAEDAGVLGDDKGKNIALYAGLGAAGFLAVGAAALIAEHVFVKQGYAFEMRKPVSADPAVSKTRGSVITASVNQVDTSYLVEHNGKPLVVFKQDNGSLIGHVLEGGTASVDSVDIMDEDGKLAAGVTLKRMSAEPIISASPRFTDAEGGELKLFMRPGGSLSAITTTEVSLTLSDKATNTYKDTDGREYVLSADLKQATAKTKPLEVGTPTFFLAQSQTEAEANHDKFKKLGEAFSAAIGTDEAPGVLEAKVVEVAPKKIFKVGDTVKDADIADYPAEVQKTIKDGRGSGVGNFDMKAEVSVEAVVDRRAVVQYVDTVTAVGDNEISEAYNARRGAYTAFIKPEIEMTHDKTNQKYKLTVRGEEVDDIVSLSFKHTPPAGGDAVETTITAKDPNQSGTMEIAGDEIWVREAISTLGRKDGAATEDHKIGTITDAGIIYEAGFSDVSFKNGADPAVDVSDDILAKVKAERSFVAGEIKKATDFVAKKNDNTNVKSLKARFTTFMDDAAMKMKIPFLNTNAGVTRDSMLTTLKNKVAALGKQASETWNKIRGKKGPKKV